MSTCLDEPIYLSEDEPVLRKLRNSFLKSESWPYITYYDSSAIKYCLHPEFWCFNAINEDGTTSIINDDIFKLVRLDTFFLTVEGFFTGQLADLSGRHPHRFSYIEPLWSLLRSDMDKLIPSAVESFVTWEDFPGETGTSVVYDMTDPELWEGFQSRWLTPSQGEGFGFVLRNYNRVSKVMALCNYQPRLQTLRLLDLPDELLDLNFHWADCAETARRLSATCYRMRDVSSVG
ncbi:uncharacterized protein ARMOST_06451 [Armillaria ostoyae]|uniref:Uncharacterized protein n=1 Tax=Armillaria ostoyae TaxID=47428 RepID=A0A284R352_ARMOS|nr:uncharacterized protein ARMOST_06451 [Armillaria ostoyae]